MNRLDNEVLQFARDELRCHELNIDTSLSTGEQQTVVEDIYELIDKYTEKFNVDCSNLNWRCYFPQIVFPFIPNCFLPAHLKSDRHQPKPFTIRMLIESAKAGRWLYE